MISLAAVEMLAADFGRITSRRWSLFPTPARASAFAGDGQTRCRHAPTFRLTREGKHASELMFPSEIIVLDKLPLLGSGKPDLVTLQKFVSEQAAAKATAAE